MSGMGTGSDAITGPYVLIEGRRRDWPQLQEDKLSWQFSFQDAMHKPSNTGLEMGTKSNPNHNPLDWDAL